MIDSTDIQLITKAGMHKTKRREVYMLLSKRHLVDLVFPLRLGRSWVLAAFFFLVAVPFCHLEAQVEAADSLARQSQDDASTPTDAPAQYPDAEAVENTGTNYAPPPIKPIAVREIGKSKWDDAAKNLDYSHDLPKQVKERRVPNQRPPDMSGWNLSTAWFGKIFQILAIILAVAAIAYGIFRTLQAPRSRPIGQAQDGTLITAENVDAYIHETDLERFLREALAAGNYALCIRLYYLQTIKVLSEKGDIKWSREKTNRDYLREMREHRHGAAFRENTRAFERVWYGNEALSAGAYAEMEPVFKGLLGKL